MKDKITENLDKIKSILQRLDINNLEEGQLNNITLIRNKIIETVEEIKLLPEIEREIYLEEINKISSQIQDYILQLQLMRDKYKDTILDTQTNMKAFKLYEQTQNNGNEQK
ncbi:MAG: hypothetical protein J0H68_06900 [Sphingobacteriia bacterium]|nr:hypothetical protein [Sphingobacteriia bacterium]